MVKSPTCCSKADRLYYVLLVGAFKKESGIIYVIEENLLQQLRMNYREKD